MQIEWDENKNHANLKKHGISFETAKLVFEDPLQISVLDHSGGGEERWRTLGAAGGVVLLLVAHTHADSGGEETIRIISARKATKRERIGYEQGH